MQHATAEQMVNRYLAGIVARSEFTRNTTTEAAFPHVDVSNVETLAEATLATAPYSVLAKRTGRRTEMTAQDYTVNNTGPRWHPEQYGPCDIGGGNALRYFPLKGLDSMRPEQAIKYAIAAFVLEAYGVDVTLSTGWERVA